MNITTMIVIIITVILTVMMIAGVGWCDNSRALPLCLYNGRNNPWCDTTHEKHGVLCLCVIVFVQHAKTNHKHQTRNTFWSVKIQNTTLFKPPLQEVHKV